MLQKFKIFELCELWDKELKKGWLVVVARCRMPGGTDWIVDKPAI